MFRAGIGDQADAGTGDLHQLLDVAATVRSHLDHRAAMAVIQTQQRHRYAQMVVEIAAGGQARPALRQDGGDHLLDRGLAIAAGDADQRSFEVCARRARRIGECHFHVGYHDLRQRQLNGARHDGSGGAGRGRGRHEIVTVSFLTAQRRE